MCVACWPLIFHLFIWQYRVIRIRLGLPRCPLLFFVRGRSFAAPPSLPGRIPPVNQPPTVSPSPVSPPPQGSKKKKRNVRRPGGVPVRMGQAAAPAQRANSPRTRRRIFARKERKHKPHERARPRKSANVCGKPRGGSRGRSTAHHAAEPASELGNAHGTRFAVRRSARNGK